MATEKGVEENGRRGAMNAVESIDPTTLYLIMPSYAEPHKREIKHIIQQEKMKLCSNKTFKSVLKMFCYLIHSSCKSLAVEKFELKRYTLLFQGSFCSN